MIPQIPKWLRKLNQTTDRLFDAIHRSEDYLLSFKWIRWALRKKLFTVIPIIWLTLQLVVASGENKALQGRVTILSESNGALREMLQANNRIMDDFEDAIWVKLKKGDKDVWRFIMLDVNEAYQKSFLEAKGYDEYDYIGRTDFDIHSPEDAREYFLEDSVVAATGHTFYAIGNFEKHPILVKKWRKIERRDTLVYGRATRIEKLIENLPELCPCESMEIN